MARLVGSLPNQLQLNSIVVGYEMKSGDILDDNLMPQMSYWRAAAGLRQRHPQCQIGEQLLDGKKDIFDVYRPGGLA